MKLWHFVFLVALWAIVLTIAQDPVGRVALTVFVTAIGEVVLGTMAVMALFQTVGAIGHADRPLAYLEAVAATVVVLLVASVTMNGVLWLGLWIVQAVAST